LGESLNILRNLREKFDMYKRTIEVARKPDKEEFVRSAKVTLIGITLIGVIGFILFVLYNLVI